MGYYYAMLVLLKGVKLVSADLGLMSTEWVNAAKRKG